MNDTTAPAVPDAPVWADADLVPLSALQHYVYCPRQCALIHVEQAWSENIYTLRGTRAHERVDDAGGTTRDGVRTERALPLFSDVHGLVGKADTEGLIAALVADHAPEKLRGSAFGVINLARGVMALLASILAGGLWTWFGPTATFATGAGLAVVTTLVALSLRPRRYT